MNPSYIFYTFSCWREIADPPRVLGTVSRGALTRTVDANFLLGIGKHLSLFRLSCKDKPQFMEKTVKIMTIGTKIENCVQGLYQGYLI